MPPLPKKSSPPRSRNCAVAGPLTRSLSPTSPTPAGGQALLLEHHPSSRGKFPVLSPPDYLHPVLRRHRQAGRRPSADPGGQNLLRPVLFLRPLRHCAGLGKGRYAPSGREGGRSPEKPDPGQRKAGGKTIRPSPPGIAAIGRRGETASGLNISQTFGFYHGAKTTAARRNPL